MHSSKCCLQRQLAQARHYSESLLNDFKSPSEWVHQVHPNANHALWFAGHMGVSDNFFISVVAAEQAVNHPEMSERFGMGSRPTTDLAYYPPIDEVVGYMKERRATLLKLLDGLTEEQLDEPTPKGTPDFLPTLASVFETAVWHEGLHSGQVSVARRSMGRGPVMGG
jgi:hypothetical protein